MMRMSELAFLACMYVRYALPYPIPNLDLPLLLHDQRTAAYTWHQAPESRPYRHVQVPNTYSLK
jgi:hypothetical protein